jgi:hypothetical protein
MRLGARKASPGIFSASQGGGKRAVESAITSPLRSRARTFAELSRFLTLSQSREPPDR